MRLIIDADHDHMNQVLAAKKARLGGIKPGDLWGAIVAGQTYSVKANKASIRVYPQTTPNSQ